MCSSGLIHRHPLSCSRYPTFTVRSSSLALLLFHFLPLSLDPPIRTLSQAPPTTTLHHHGIRPNAAPVSTFTHPNAGGSANRRSYRRKDGGVTRDSSRSLVVPRHVPLLYYWDDYLPAGALISRECLNIVSFLMSSDLARGFLAVVQVEGLSTVLPFLPIGPPAAAFPRNCLQDTSFFVS